MPLIYPNGGAIKLANTLRTDLANSVVHLFQTGLVPTVGTTLAQLVAAEATYDGYASITIVAFGASYLDPAGGATIVGGVEQFNFVYAAGTTNSISGFWLQDTANVVIAIGTFDAPFLMVQNGNAIPLTVALNAFRSGAN